MVVVFELLYLRFVWFELVSGTLTMSKSAEAVKVVVRCRPINQKELDQGHYV